MHSSKALEGRMHLLRVSEEHMHLLQPMALWTLVDVLSQAMQEELEARLPLVEEAMVVLACCTEVGQAKSLAVHSGMEQRS